MLPDVTLLDDCAKLVRRQKSEALLWHYTTLEAGLKILESRRVYLTCHNFMNDPAEGARSPRLVSAAWNVALDRVGSHPILDVEYLRSASKALERFTTYGPHVAPAFLFCTSLLRDSLSQWARYGGDGAGLALGFRLSPAAFQAFSPGWSYGPFLCEMFYEPSSGDERDVLQRHVGGQFDALGVSLASALERFVRAIRSPTEAENGLGVRAHALGAAVKQHAYHEEREWRVVAYTDADSTSLYKMRATRLGIAPYMELPFGDAIDLEEIILGPKLDPANQWTTQWLCRKFGSSAVVSRSALSYR